MNKTLQNKRNISFDKTISAKHRRFSSKLPIKKHRSYTNFFNKNAKSIRDYLDINNPYMPFWLTKILMHKYNNNRENQTGHMPHIKIINHKNMLFEKTRNYFYSKGNRTLDYCDRLCMKNNFHENQKFPKKIRIIPKRNFNQGIFSTNSIINMKQFHTNNYKYENYKFEDDIPIKDEQEKRFEKIKQDFSRTRKEIIEEPEYLEEDS